MPANCGEVRAQRTENQQAEQRDLGREVHESKHAPKYTLFAMTLDATVALVTGASSGIGYATAKALAAQGAKVALAARRKDRLDELAEEIDGLAIEADVTDREQAINAVETTANELGRLDIVVNNAGVMLLGNDRRRAGRGVGPDDRAQRPGADVRRPRRDPAPAQGGRVDRAASPTW